MTSPTPGERDPARFNAAIRQLYRGGSNNTGTVTLRANQVTTVVNHQSCNPTSHISVMPLTLSALNAFIAPPAPPKIYQLTRLLTAAAANVAYTGLGFKPSFIRFQCGVSGGSGWTSDGSSDGSSNTALETALNSGTGTLGSFYQNGLSGIVRTDALGANFGFFSLLSFDADGFTLAWGKTGTPAATTASVMATCTPATGPAGGGNVGGVRVSSRTTGSFTLTHASNAAVDQTFTYSITGGA